MGIGFKTDDETEVGSGLDLGLVPGEPMRVGGVRTHQREFQPEQTVSMGRFERKVPAWWDGEDAAAAEAAQSINSLRGLRG